MKLELKHLAPYLPYGLKWIYKGEKLPDGFDNWGIRTIKIESLHTTFERINQGHTSIILRPLTDLNYDFCRDYDLQREKVKSYLKSGRINLRQYTYLIENHFDVFGLIDKGLAIDINTIQNEKTK